MVGDRVALLVNNLGSTSDLEMNIVASETIKLLGNVVYFCSIILLSHPLARAIFKYLLLM